MIVLGSHPNQGSGSAFSEEKGPDTLQSCLIEHEANTLNVDVSLFVCLVLNDASTLVGH